MSKKIVSDKAIYDARELGVGKMMLLGFQHTFAMFGATVLVPMLTGLSISATLLMAGLGTLLFHFLTKGKVPAFLGSSFAFLAGYGAIAPLINGAPNDKMIPYACLGVACAGLLYLILALLFKVCDVKKVMKFFPPVVTGPIIIAIGLILAPTAINNCSQDWILAIVALATIVICNIWGKGMIKIIPILMGIFVSYIVAVCWGKVDFTAVKEAAWIGLPINTKHTVLNVTDSGMAVTAIVAIMPIALASMMEHIGDISAISSTVGKNYLADPGLHRTLMGDGLATTFSALFGGPANTTYGENTGVLALTKVYDPKVVRIAACFAIVLSFFPKISAAISTIPSAIIGGVSLILYGMISAIGTRNLVENKVDLAKSRNVIIAAIILGTALGFAFKTVYGPNGEQILSSGLTFHLGEVNITLSGLAIAAILGILFNAILPGKDYEFKTDKADDAKTGVSFEV